MMFRSMLFAMALLLLAGCSRGRADEYFNEALSFYRSQQYQTAIADLDKAIGLQPDNAKYYLYRGLAKIRNSDEINAQADLDRSIKLNPRYEQAYMERALLARFKDGKYEKPGVALVNITQVLKLNSHNDSVYYWLGMIKSEMADLKGSLAAFDRYLSDHPKSYKGYMARASVKVADMKSAIDDYSAAITLRPQSAEAYFRRGTCKFLNGDKQATKVDWLKAAQLGYPDAQQAIKDNGL